MKPKQDPWRRYTGGQRPTAASTIIQVQTRSGVISQPMPASHFDWVYPTFSPNDIYSWREADAMQIALYEADRAYGAMPKTVSEVKDTNPKDAIGDKKVPLWLLSPIAKAHWALAQFAGMLKYGAWNWRKAGVRTSVYLSAIDRHKDKWMSGQKYDPADGTHHLANIMACCAILMDAEAAGKLTDDRPPSVDVESTYRFVEERMAELREKYKDKDPKHYTIADSEEVVA